MKMRLLANTNGDPVLGVSFPDEKDADEFFGELETYGERFADPAFARSVRVLQERTTHWKSQDGKLFSVLSGDEAVQFLECMFETVLVSNILFERMQKETKAEK